ncbi:MAG: hypothetical protein WBB87_13325 [Candidatus Microthrix parvicella]|jgi:hypothetical protein|nr:hypothetical protein [Candidatus Microthrix sp.]MBK6500849.1 hypothetical protein [Candidatus Microthrix sp.]
MNSTAIQNIRDRVQATRSAPAAQGILSALSKAEQLMDADVMLRIPEWNEQDYENCQEAFAGSGLAAGTAETYVRRIRSAVKQSQQEPSRDNGPNEGVQQPATNPNSTDSRKRVTAKPYMVSYRIPLLDGRHAELDLPEEPTRADLDRLKTFLGLFDEGSSNG